MYVTESFFSTTLVWFETKSQGHYILRLHRGMDGGSDDCLLAILPWRCLFVGEEGRKDENQRERVEQEALFRESW